MELHDLTDVLRERKNLSPYQAALAARAMCEEAVSLESKRAFLEALAEKGESVEEITAFARVFRELAVDPGFGEAANEAIDIVGTGGSGSNGYNFSSVSALMVACAGGKVLKHGNRAITSQSGAADFLSTVGVPAEMPSEQLHEAFARTGFAFLFAPNFHPAFRQIMPVRKAMAADGKRSIFNLLGPLINPARPRFQLLGVYSRALVKPMAQSLHTLGLTNGLVVHCSLHGGGGMDEFSCAGDNYVVGFGKNEFFEKTLRPENLGLEICPVNEVQGGDAAQNRRLLDALMQGQAPRGLEDSLCCNAGAALWILGKCHDLSEGIETAREILHDRAFAEWIHNLPQLYNR